MATEGKVPTLGFGAASIGFVVLLGFSPQPNVYAVSTADRTETSAFAETTTADADLRTTSAETERTT